MADYNVSPDLARTPHQHMFMFRGLLGSLKKWTDFRNLKGLVRHYLNISNGNGRSFDCIFYFKRAKFSSATPRNSTVWSPPIELLIQSSCSLPTLAFFPLGYPWEFEKFRTDQAGCFPENFTNRFGYLLLRKNKKLTSLAWEDFGTRIKAISSMVASW